MTEFIDVLQLQGFIEAVWMSGRWYKKLNLPIEF